MKKMLSVLLASVVAAALFAGCGQSPAPQASGDSSTAQETTTGEEASTDAPATDGSFKVGISLQSLANAYWAGVFSEVEALIKDKGWEYTIVDCKDNSGEQINQIENFITSGCNLIMVHPSDPNAIEDVLAKARENGIKVMSWDDAMENTDLNWVLDNQDLGRAIGSAAADFINEHYSADNKAEVAIMNYPQTPILKDREDGILEGLKAADGKYDVVAQQPALQADQAQSHMETILQANPNVKVVCSIGAGGDVGANQAFMAHTNGNIPADMGIFSADATQEQLQAIVDGEASRVSVGFEGSNKKTAAAVVDLYERLLNGEEFPDQNLVRPLLPIGADNAEEYLNDYK